MKQTILKKTMDIIIIFIFIEILVIPLLCLNTNPENISVVANRGLAKKPQFKKEGGALNFNFINEFNAYINDNVGFREEANIFRLAKMYQLFKKVDIPGFMQGKEKHMFQINSGEMIQTFLGHDLLSSEQLERFDTALEGQKSILNQQELNFIL